MLVTIETVTIAVIDILCHGIVRYVRYIDIEGEMCHAILL